MSEVIEGVMTIDDEIASAGPAKRYDFDVAFQQKIAALLMRDTPFAQLTEGLIKPEFFESTAHAAMVSLTNMYYAKYKKTPGDKATVTEMIRSGLEKRFLTKDMASLAAGCVKELFTTDISDRDFVADECATFARHQALTNAILDSVNLIENRNYDAAALAVTKAASTGLSLTGGTYDYAERIAERTQTRKERAAGIAPKTGITTGIPILDGHLYHKGWGRKELSVLMGGPKAGKSMAMINFSVNAIARMYSVLYVTLEVSEEIIAERIDANISERAMMELELHSDEVEDKVADFMGRAGRLIIKEFPSGSMRVSDLNRLLEAYKAQGLLFDLVVVDYADLMTAERITDNIQENSKSIYVNLRGIAMREGIAILTATQTNREGAKKAVASMTDIAEDINKVRIADVLISINRNEDDISKNQARLHFAASRNQRSGFTIKIRQDMQKGKFIESVIGDD